MSLRKHLKPLVLTAGIALGCATVAPPGAAAEEQAEPDTQLITVHGSGEVRVRPDSLRLNVGVDARADTVDAARNSANTLMRRVLDAVRALAYPNVTLETTILQVTPLFGPPRDGQAPFIVGYAASNHVIITVMKTSVETLGDRGSRLLDTALNAGANSVGGIEFFLADPSQANRTALTAAVQAAARDAATIAAAAGVTLDGLYAIEEMPSGRPIGRAATLSSGSSTPVEVSDLMVQSSVTAKFMFHEHPVQEQVLPSRGALDARSR